jgi:hypothetical protein
MIYICVPNIALFAIWLYCIKFNIFLSILLTPFSFLIVNGVLIYYKQYNNVYNIFDKTIVLKITENLLKSFFVNLFKLINKISIVNKFFNLLKVKILVYIFNMIVNLIPSKKSNELTNDLQNDYLDILNKNRNKKLSSNPVSI